MASNTKLRELKTHLEYIVESKHIYRIMTRLKPAIDETNNMFQFRRV